MLLMPGTAVAAPADCREINGSLEEVTRVSGNSFTTFTGTYRFDSNDGFAFGAEGDVATFRQFKDALKVGTEVQLFTYCRDRDGESGIALVNLRAVLDAEGAGDRGNNGRDKPRGGVEAGAGGMADPASPALPAAGALLGTALLGAGVMAARRRATAK